MDMVFNGRRSRLLETIVIYRPAMCDRVADCGPGFLDVYKVCNYLQLLTQSRPQSLNNVGTQIPEVVCDSPLSSYK